MKLRRGIVARPGRVGAGELILDLEGSIPVTAFFTCRDT